MTPAYDKTYLSCAQKTLGRMLDFAVYDLGYGLSTFYDLFLDSELSSQFGHGDFHLIAGMSGVELTYEVLDSSDISYDRVSQTCTTSRSPEYWVGWTLAYYQWYTSLSFEEINDKVPIQKVLDLYHPYHEMDVHHSIDKINELCSNVQA